MEEEVLAKMNFIEYKITDFNFKLNENHKKSDLEQSNPEYHPEIFMMVGKHENDSDAYCVRLGININEEPEDFPFELSITLEGWFGFEGCSDNEIDGFLKYNAVAALFPYLRATISQITLFAGCSALVLPLLNITELINHAEQVSINDVSEVASELGKA
ncbi:MAG: protein-export chaperone SecB [Christensenellaceae bacterium]